ncbi:TPA: molecular chaperone [Citrobacter amalonaticus]|nr:molecular chaperone [Citrobacter amalonaticus]
MRKLLQLLIVVFVFSGGISAAHAGGVQIGRTRVIYNANDKEEALPIINKGADTPWLVQSWVDTGDGKTRGPFIITPPLFRLDPQKEQSLRIIWSGVPLPENRESLFYINVRTIPASDKANKDSNMLRLIYKTRLKLFFRPQGLKGTPTEACRNLTFTRDGKTLRVNNNSNYYTVFDSLFMANTAIPGADTVSPASTVALHLPANTASQTVTWRCISDYGNASEKFSFSLK